MEGPYLRKWGAKHIFLYTVGGPYPKQCTLKISGPYSGAFDISEPDVYLRYNKIGVYMEGPYLRKWGEKHILLYTVGGTSPIVVHLKVFMPLVGGLQFFGVRCLFQM